MAADPYCASFDQALNGVFKSIWQEGSMVWKGGTKGTVEIIGADFNEMTCEFEVISCEDGQISMLCNGSVFNTSIDLYSPDSIKINQMVYVRVSEFTVK